MATTGNSALRGQFNTAPLVLIRTVSFITLSAISIALSVYLFLQFSTHAVERALFGAVALAFEGSKLYALVEGHREWKARKWFPGLIKISVYSLLALLSVVASYGFSLGALQRAGLDADTGTYNIQKQSYTRQIEMLDMQIDNLVGQQSRLPDGWITASQRLMDSIQELSLERTDAYIQLNSLQPPDFDLASNAFMLIGESIGVPGNVVMFWLLILLSILIEVCIVFTAPGTYIEIDREEELEVEPLPLPPVQEESEHLVELKELPIRKKEKKIEVEEQKAELRPIPTREPATPKADLFEAFVHLLFNNGTEAHIRSASEVKESFTQAHTQATGREEHTAAIAMIKKFWTWLLSTEGPTGYKLIEKRNDYYFPNYTAELIINHFKSLREEA